MFFSATCILVMLVNGNVRKLIMNKHMILALNLTIFLICSFHSPVRAGTTDYRQLPVEVYRDKMKAGWIGQIAGVAWGAPTEFKYSDKIIPEEAMPKWRR